VFSRQLILGDNLDTQNIAASYDGGVLTLMIPVAEQAKPPQDHHHQRQQRPAGHQRLTAGLIVMPQTQLGVNGQFVVPGGGQEKSPCVVRVSRRC